MFVELLNQQNIPVWNLLSTRRARTSTKDGLFAGFSAERRKLNRDQNLSDIFEAAKFVVNIGTLYCCQVGNAAYTSVPDLALYLDYFSRCVYFQTSWILERHNVGPKYAELKLRLWTLQLSDSATRKRAVSSHGGASAGTSVASK